MNWKPHSVPSRISCACFFWICTLSLLLPRPGRGASVIINEVLAANQTIAPLAAFPDYFPDYAELYNGTDTPINLGAGWSLSVKRHPKTNDLSDYFNFPAGTIIQPDSYLLVFFDDKTNFPGIHTTWMVGAGRTATKETFNLKRTGDELLLFDTTSKVVPHDSVIFGMQVPDHSIGRVPDFTGPFTLTLPTPCGGTIPCQTNTPFPYRPAPTIANEFSIRINEWLATNSSGPDWFELYNPDTNVVTLSGLVFVDKVTNLGVPSRSRPVPDLSFIGPLGFVQMFASDNNNDDAPADEVAFSISSNSGDDIYMFANDKFTVLDYVRSTLISTNNNGYYRNISEGRVPDGDITGEPIQLPKLSPEASNFGEITNVVINEVIAHTDPPLEDAIELYNPTSAPVDLSLFWLSNDPKHPMKYQIPTNTVISAHGFKVFYEYQFDPNETGFTFNSANGDEAWLFSSNTNGGLSGFRVGVRFGASENGVSFGRYMTSDDRAEFVPMRDLSLGTTVRAGDPVEWLGTYRTGTGATNPGPRVGPIVINEIHYHPPDIQSGTNILDNSVDEFLELYNISGNDQKLFDNNIYRADRDFNPAPDGTTLRKDQIYADGRTNTWRLRGGVDFEFPEDITLGAGQYLLLVNFAPTNITAWTSFTNHVGVVPPEIQVFGPYKGKLANGSASVELQRPDAPQSPLHPDFRLVPYLQVERVKYSDEAPWPVLSQEDNLSPDGGGPSLQRLNPTAYGNDPINWRARMPTPGQANLEVPSILAQPESQSVPAGSSVDLAVDARGTSLRYQWKFNSRAIKGQTNSLLHLSNVSTRNSGSYQVTVVNVAGSVTSSVARLTVIPTDTTRPTVSFVTPAAGVIASETVNVTGKSSDNFGVNAVYVSVNGSDFLAATGSVTYSVWGLPESIAPERGTNSLRAYSVDVAGNLSLTNERTFFRSVRIPITLSTTGAGTISGATDQQLLEFGRAFTLNATANPGNVLSNWLIYSNSVLIGQVSTPTLTYLMIDNLSVVANFVPNPFRPSAGRYSGLFFGTNVQHGSSGFFTLTATERGSYTASLLHDSRKLSASGQFDLDGKATNTVKRAGTNDLSVIWSIDLNGSDQIGGQVSDGSWIAPLQGDRAVFNASSRPFTNAGKFTFTIQGIPGETNAPAGHSYGTLGIDANGVVKLSGFLADKGKAKQTVPLSKNGEYPLYIPLVKGSLIGWVALEDRATDDLHGLVNWHKLPSLTAPYYRSGFNKQTMLLGSRYIAPLGPTNHVLHLDNGTIHLSDGNLPENYTNSFILGLANKVTNGGPSAMTLTFTPSTGLFKGSLTPEAGLKPIAFSGAVLQKATNGFGYGLGTNQSSSVTLGPAN